MELTNEERIHHETLIMGSQLRWLERTPDKREVDGSIPFEPTKYIENCIDKKVNQHTSDSMKRTKQLNQKPLKKDQ